MEFEPHEIPSDSIRNRYTYSRLDSSSDSIRLLHLDHNLEYKLETYSIQSCPPFIALSYTWGEPLNTQNIQIDGETLSYTWGEPLNTQNIQIDGETLQIQHNLSLCLTAIAAEIALPPISKLSRVATSQSHLARIRWRRRMFPFLHERRVILGRNDEIRLWIDAICINQNDTAERNHQVNLMKRIYSTAGFVLVWLGQADDESNFAFDEISRLDTTRAESDDLPHNPRLDDAVESLFQRDYWGRLWVIQELMLAQDILLMCGSRTLRWPTLVRWLQKYRHGVGATDPDIKPNLFMETRGGRLVEQKIVWQRNVSLNCGYSLDLLIELFHEHKCTDARDKVYGLLGLLTPQNIPGSQDIVCANYGKTRIGVYNQVLEAVRHSPRLQTERSRSRFCRTLQKSLQLSLSYEAAGGNEAMVKLLLEDGADPGWAAEHERTPLLAAVERGHEKVVRLLLEKGANLESKTEYRQTPLLLAVKEGRSVAIRLLLAQGVSQDLEDKFKQTPLFFATPQRKPWLELILEKVNVDLNDQHERTLVSLAAKRGHKAVVRLMIEKGAGLALKKKEKQSKLSLKVETEHQEVIWLLLKKGADLDLEDGYRQTPLLLAAERGHEAVARLLLEKGADLDPKDEYGRSPLSLAAGRGHEAVVRLLLEKGADVDSKDEHGDTPLFFAMWNHEVVVRLLVEKGADTSSKYGKTLLSLLQYRFPNITIPSLVQEQQQLGLKRKRRDSGSDRAGQARATRLHQER